MYEVITTVFPAALVIFQGYCLQYFLGSFLESRLKSRWNGLYVAALYVVLKMAVFGGISSGYENSKAAVGTLALSIVLLAFPAICFYKAFRPVTAFLVVSFQAVLAISSYVAVILLDKVGAGCLMP